MGRVRASSSLEYLEWDLHQGHTHTSLVHWRWGIWKRKSERLWAVFWLFISTISSLFVICLPFIYLSLTVDSNYCSPECNKTPFFELPCWYTRKVSPMSLLSQTFSECTTLPVRVWSGNKTFLLCTAAGLPGHVANIHSTNLSAKCVNTHQVHSVLACWGRWTILGRSTIGRLSSWLSLAPYVCSL